MGITVVALMGMVWDSCLLEFNLSTALRSRRQTPPAYQITCIRQSEKPTCVLSGWHQCCWMSCRGDPMVQKPRIHNCLTATVSSLDEPPTFCHRRLCAPSEHGYCIGSPSPSAMTGCSVLEHDTRCPNKNPDADCRHYLLYYLQILPSILFSICVVNLTLQSIDLE